MSDFNSSLKKTTNIHTSIIDCLAYDVDTPGIPKKTILYSDTSTISSAGKEYYPASD